MSGPSTNPENDLSSTLARQAEQFARRGGADLDIAQVVSRAGEIRRGRRMRASIAMAAVVLAVAVPVGVTVIGNNPATTPPSPPIASAGPADTSPLEITALPAGDPPSSAYALDGQLYSGGIGPIDVADLGDVVEVARITGGFLVASASETDGTTTATFVADDGTRGDETWPYAGGFAVSGDRSVGVLVQPDGAVVAVQDGGARAYEIGTLPPGGAYRVASVTGPDCAPGADPSGCTVYVNDGGNADQVWVVTPGQESFVLGRGFLQLAGASTVYAGRTSVDELEPGSCSKVTDAGFKQMWETCDYSLESFSPAGEYLLGGPAYQSGSGDGQLAILDAQTGKVLLSLMAGDGVEIFDARWEDDGHVLAVLAARNSYAIVRVALDGSREYAVDPVPGSDDYVSPFRLG